MSVLSETNHILLMCVFTSEYQNDAQNVLADHVFPLFIHVEF